MQIVGPMTPMTVDSSYIFGRIAGMRSSGVSDDSSEFVVDSAAEFTDELTVGISFNRRFQARSERRMEKRQRQSARRHRSPLS